MTGNVSFDGEQYRVHAPLERAGDPAGPPVLLAAMAPVMLRICGEQTDGTILWMTGPKTVGEHVGAPAVEGGSRCRAPRTAVVATLPVAVTNDPDGARKLADGVFQIYGNLPSYRAMLDREGAAGPGDVAIVGDEATVVAGIRSMADAGTTEFVGAVFGDGATMARTSEVLLGLQSARLTERGSRPRGVSRLGARTRADGRQARTRASSLRAWSTPSLSWPPALAISSARSVAAWMTCLACTWLR